MAATVDGFLALFPEFTSVSGPATPALTQWLAVGTRLVSSDAWDDLTDFGVYLFTAHYFSLAQRDARAAFAGQTPGGAVGAIASKSVDKVSVSYDNASARIEGAGHWNMTSYGVRFATLARQMGAGGLQF